MKFLVSQMAALIQRGQQKANTRLMVRFLLILLGFFAAFTVLFHFLMAYEGQDHSWITGLYWTLTVMSTPWVSGTSPSPRTSGACFPFS